jgi:hypothetical protein
MNERRKDFMKIKFLFGRKFFYSFHEKDKNAIAVSIFSVKE